MSEHSVGELGLYHGEGTKQEHDRLLGFFFPHSAKWLALSFSWEIILVTVHPGTVSFSLWMNSAVPGSLYFLLKSLYRMTDL